MNETSDLSQTNADAIFTALRDGADDHLHTIFEKLEKKWELVVSEENFDNNESDRYDFSMELSYDFKTVIQQYLESSKLGDKFNQMTDDWKVFVTITLFDDWMFRTKVRPK
jgi:hypothetical protein